MATIIDRSIPVTSQGRARLPAEGAHTSGRPAREERWVPTVCTMCYNSCSVQVLVRDGVAVAVEGTPGAPPNFGKTNGKSKSMLAELYSPTRVTRPLLRTNPEKGLGIDPKWKEITWEEALDIMTARLKELRQRNPRGLSMSTFDSVGSSNILRAFVSAFGGDDGTTVPQSSGLFCGNGVHPVAYMMNGSEDHQPDLAHCRYMLVLGGGFGTGVGTHAMHMAHDLSRARAERGLKMVVVDPCRNSSGNRADEWIPILPGTDAAFCLAVVNLLINEFGMYDEGFLRKYTNAPYLVRPNGHYARDGATGKPLMLSLFQGVQAPHDAMEDKDIALDGECEVNGERVRTAFTLLKGHLKKYTPEYTSQVTTIPAATIRRIAREFGTAAQIGATTVVDGVTLPLRPACAIWYRGVGQHQHGLANGWAAAMLNIVVGAVDVPGASCQSGATGPWGIPQPGVDGLLTPTRPMGVMRRSIPPKPAAFEPGDPDLTSMFPATVYSRTMGGLTLRDPEKYKVDYNLAFWICVRANPMKSAGDPVQTAEILRKVPFQLSFVQHHEETSEFADMILPDTHFLERLVPFAYNSLGGFAHSPTPGDKEWTFSIQQPVVKPTGQARHYGEVMWELAHRVGVADDFYSAINVTEGLCPEHRLNRGGRYTYEEFCDRWMRCWCGEDKGLDYFKEHGWAAAATKREVKHRYPRIFHEGRIPLYLEHWLTAGESVREVVAETGIEWGDLSDYEPLVNYRPCWASKEGGEDFPFYLQSPKVAFLTLNTSAIKNPQLQELAWSTGQIFNAGIHPSVARKLGISPGDTIEMESANGKKVTIQARVTEDVHPMVVSAPGNVAKVLSPNEKNLAGEGVHLNSFIPYRIERVDMVSAALDACVKIRIRKIKDKRTGNRSNGSKKGLMRLLRR